jgi:hypothetical protein
VSPVTVAVVVALVAVAPPGLAVTVYKVIAEPPLKGADQEIIALLSAASPATFVGASGTVAGVTALLAAEAEPVPIALVAVTVNVYSTPLVSPVTVIGELPPVPVNPPGLDVTV